MKSRHVVALAVGSRGDVQPLIALGQGMQKAGYRVTLATHALFEGAVRHFGLSFRPLSADPLAILNSPGGQSWLSSPKNSLSSLARMSAAFRPYIARYVEETWAACRDAEAILFAPLSIAGYRIAEKLRVPGLMMPVFPISPTRSFPSVLASTRYYWPGLVNRWSHQLTLQLFWRFFWQEVDRQQARLLQLPRTSWWGPYRHLHSQNVPYIYGISPLVLPKPEDWPSWHHLAGFWFLPNQGSWRPPEALRQFLLDGPEPICMGFGSMVGAQQGALAEKVVRAIHRTGKRAVLLTGWGALPDNVSGEQFFVLKEAQHQWLFPRVAAVIHHGGAGTTAATLRAGKPAIVVPFLGDQFFWGRQLLDLGVGTQPIAARKLQTITLAKAIDSTLADRHLRKQVVDLGEKIKKEDGVEQAVSLVSASLEAHST